MYVPRKCTNKFLELRHYLVNFKLNEILRVFKMSLYLEIRIYTTKFSKNNQLNRSLLWSEVVSPLWQFLWQISHRICQTKVIKEPFECNLDVHI